MTFPATIAQQLEQACIASLHYRGQTIYQFDEGVCAYLMGEAGFYIGGPDVRGGSDSEAGAKTLIDGHLDHLCQCKPKEHTFRLGCPKHPISGKLQPEEDALTFSVEGV